MRTPVDVSIFGDMKPIKTYIYCDGPLAYTIENGDKTFYVHWYDHNDEGWLYWVREATPEEFLELENNKITLKQFIKNASPFYLVIENGEQTSAFIVNHDDFPDESYPDPTCYLNREDT